MSAITDLYEMTPVQAGMLFHTLMHPGSYVQQYSGKLTGPLDLPGFQEAWQGVIARHDILRAACHWEDIPMPALAIHADVSPDWQILDWSGDAPNPTRLQEWLAQDRQQEFDLDRAPLMRFALIRLAPEEHVFVWSFHHLLLDGWCGALLVREMLAFYGGAVPGPAAPSFRAYTEWCAEQDQDAAKAFWQARLMDADLPTPLGHARPGAEGRAEYRLSLPAALTTRIMETARSNRLTLATLLQGVWALLLARYGGVSDVTFGTVFSGRPPELPHAEEMIGLFLQTLPQRVKVPDDAAPLDWLAQIQGDQHKASQFGAVALGDIQNWSGAKGPLFDSLLTIETYPESIEAVAARGGQNMTLSDVQVYERTSYPLTAKLLPGARIELCLMAETSHIPSRILPQIAADFERVAEALIENPASLGHVTLLDDRAEMARERSAAGFDQPLPPLVPEHLRNCAAQHPDTLAVEIPGGSSLSYGALMERAAQIAGGLAARGVGPGQTVAICQDRGADLLASMLAVWHLGAAYLPLDPLYPADRITFILDDAKAAMLLVDAFGADALPGASNIIARLDDLSGPAVPAAKIDSQDRAYVLYTSGSTGQPKGVPITHAALANFLNSIAHTPGLRDDDRLLAVTTVAFDIAALELFGPLWVGGAVIIAPSGAGMDGKALARLLANQRATVMQATPAGWRVLRDSGWNGINGLRMFSGGEALDSDLARDLLGLGAELWNLYGPTETTIWSAAMQVQPEHLDGPAVPIGGALDRTTLSLRDPAGRCVPRGVPGELWIGGAGLSPGYSGRAELTAARFVDEEGHRQYRTGDQMRQREDGLFDVLGRLDDQVKLRGYRIELGEIEQRLTEHPAIHQAVVQVRGSGETARLSAWLRSDTPPEPNSLRRHLAASLPAYMIPAAWTFVDDFPLTPNGKIDRKSLPDPKAAPATHRKDISQDLMAQIWAEILDVPSVAPEDDFFALGGHSLTALRLLAKIREALGLDPALRDIFEAPTLASFTARIGLSPPALPPIPRNRTRMLSPAQQRQWLLWKMDPNRTDYLLPLAVALDGPLDRSALVQSLTSLTFRHEILRTRFPERSGLATVELMPDGPALAFHDLSQTPNPEAALTALRNHHAETPFDPRTAPPWRADLITLAPERHILLLTLHHILADEWSFRIMLHDLIAGYTGQPNPDLSIQYSDFATWQNLRDPTEALQFWKDTLAGAPALTELPHIAGSDTQTAGRAAFEIPAETAQALDHLCRAQGITRFMLLLAAYGLFLDKHSGQGDLIIGIPASHRQQAETQNLIGLFVNTLPIRLRPAPTLPFTGLLAQTRTAVLSAQAHQELPFEDIIDALGTPRNDHPPLVQTLFSMPDLPGSGAVDGRLNWATLPGVTPNARFDLALEMTWDDTGLHGHFDHNPAHISPDLAERLAKRFAALVETLSFAAELPVGELPVTLPADRCEPGSDIHLPCGEWASDPAFAAPSAESGLLFGPRLAVHLAALPNDKPDSVATCAAPGSLTLLAAKAIAAKNGLVLDQSGPEDALKIGYGTQAKILRLGDLRTDAEFCGPPECPAAFRQENGRLTPCAGIMAHVLGADMAPLPPGCRGQLAVGGGALARGYAGDPRRTAARFVPNLLADADDFDPASNCLFLTGLYARQDLVGDFILCAAPETLRLGMQDQTGDTSFVPPQGQLELEIARIWADLLGQAHIGRHDSFFDRGGDSVLAIQVAAEACAVSLDITPMDLFVAPTIAGLAERAVPQTASILPKLPVIEGVDPSALEALVSFGFENP